MKYKKTKSKSHLKLVWSAPDDLDPIDTSSKPHKENFQEYQFKLLSAFKACNEDLEQNLNKKLEQMNSNKSSEFIQLSSAEELIELFKPAMLFIKLTKLFYHLLKASKGNMKDIKGHYIYPIILSLCEDHADKLHKSDSYEEARVKKSCKIFSEFCIVTFRENAYFYFLKGHCENYNYIDRKNAIKPLTTAISLAPNYTEAYIEISETYKSLGKNSRALSYINKAIGIDPENAQGYRLKSDIYISLNQYDAVIKICDRLIKSSISFMCTDWAYRAKREAMFKLKRYEEALEVCKEHEKWSIMHESHFKEWLNRTKGDILYTLNRIDEAFDCYIEVIKADESYIPYFISHLSDLYEAGYEEKTLIYYDKAIQIHPYCFKLYFKKCYLLVSDMKRFDEGLIFSEEILSRKEIFFPPKMGRIHYLRGLAYFNLGRFEEAMFEYSKVIELMEDNGECYWGDEYTKKAEVLEKLERFENVIEHYNNRIATKGATAYEYIGKAKALQKLHRTEEAIVVIDEGLEKYLNDSPILNSALYKAKAECFLTLGLQNEANKSYQQALWYCDEAMARSPGYYYYYLRKSELLIGLRHYQDAVSVLNEAIELSPNSAEAHQKKAEALYLTSNYKEAIPHFDNAIALRLNDPEVYFKRAVALFKEGQMDLALASAEEILKLDPNNTEAYYLVQKILVKEKRYKDIERAQLKWRISEFCGGYRHKGAKKSLFRFYEHRKICD